MLFRGRGDKLQDIIDRTFDSSPKMQWWMKVSILGPKIIITNWSTLKCLQNVIYHVGIVPNNEVWRKSWSVHDTCLHSMHKLLQRCSVHGGTTKTLFLMFLGDYLIGWIKNIFGSVRRSRNSNLCPSVCSVQVCFELSIFIFLAQFLNQSSNSHQVGFRQSLSHL